MTEIKKSYVRQIAKALGVQIGEHFRIKGHPTIGTFWFVEDNSEGPRDFWEYKLGSEYYDTDIDLLQILEQILAGYYEIEKLPWKPKKGEAYYTPLPSFSCLRAEWSDTNTDMSRWKAGLCFKNEKEALTIGAENLLNLRKEYEKA